MNDGSTLERSKREILAASREVIALPQSGSPPQLPMIHPEPPRLSQHVQELADIEAGGTYSNYGPVNTRFETELVRSFFQTGGCLTVCNATIGLMIAIREVIGDDRPHARKYALMPSFTFAATAHAALWCGLTPLLCDIDPETWLPDQRSEEALLQQYAGEVAVIVPYATFGNNLDLARYQQLSETYDVPVVVDAAASLGSLDEEGQAFGSGFSWPLVFSMHATKAFSVGEGGVIYCADRERLARLRAMGSFGFEQSRSAMSLGLNSKLTEVAALTALLQLRKFGGIVDEREALSRCYRAKLPRSLTLQRLHGRRQVKAFESVLLPAHLIPRRDEILLHLQRLEIGSATYFSPHLAEQPYFKKHAISSSLPVTEDVGKRIISLPLRPGMLPQQVEEVANAISEVIEVMSPRSESRPFGQVFRKPISAEPANIIGNRVPRTLRERSRLPIAI